MIQEAFAIIRQINRDTEIHDYYVLNNLAKCTEEAMLLAQNDLINRCPIFPGIIYDKVTWGSHLAWDGLREGMVSNDIRFEFEGHVYVIRYVICPRTLTL